MADLEIGKTIKAARVGRKYPQSLWPVVPIDATPATSVGAGERPNEHAIIGALTQNLSAAFDRALLTVNHVAANLHSGKPIEHVALPGTRSRNLRLFDRHRCCHRPQMCSDRRRFSSLNEPVKLDRQRCSAPRITASDVHHAAKHVCAPSNPFPALQPNVLREFAPDLVAFLKAFR